VGIVERVFTIVHKLSVVLHQVQFSAKMDNVYRTNKAVRQQTFLYLETSRRV